MRRDPFKERMKHTNLVRSMKLKQSIDLSVKNLSSKEQKAVTKFVETVRGVFGDGLRSVTMYGTAARGGFRSGMSTVDLLIVVENLELGHLKQLLDAVVKGRRYGIAPFLLTAEDLRSSTDVFPVKFLSIKRSRHVVLGDDILGAIAIGREHLRLRCEQEIKNLLLGLRRAYLRQQGHGLTEIMTQRLEGFMETLRATLSLVSDEPIERSAVTGSAAQQFGVDAAVLERIDTYRKKESVPKKKEAEALYARFMQLVEGVARAVDQLDVG